MATDVKSLAEKYLNNTDFVQWDWQDLISFFEQMFQQEGFREENNDGQQHILLLRLDAMGDMVLSTGFVREVRRNYPTAYITLLVSPAIYPLVCDCPYVNRILVLNVSLFYSEKKEFFSELLQLCVEYLWQERYDFSICPQWGDDKTIPEAVAYLSGARQRFGYSCNTHSAYGFPLLHDEMEKALMTDVFIIPRNIIHEAERTLYLLKVIGMKIEADNMELWYGKKELAIAKKLLASVATAGRTLIAVGLGAGIGNRKYPVKQYAEVLKILDRKYTCGFVILGGNSEQADAEMLRALLPSKTIVCNLTGLTSVLETAAVLSKTDIYVGNDTGVMHMAAAVGIPVVMVSREEDDFCGNLAGVLSENQRFAPWQTNHVICCPDERAGDCAGWLGYGGCKEQYSHCICNVKPDEVVKGVEILLQ